MNGEKRKKAPIFATVRRALSLVIQSGSMCALTLNTIWILCGAATSITAIFNKNVLNAAAEVIKGDGQAFHTAVFWLIIWAAVEIGKTLLDVVMDYFDTRMWMGLELFVEEKVLGQVSRLKMRYLDDREDQKKIRNVKGNFSGKISVVTWSVIDLLNVAVRLITAVVVIANENWIISVLVLVTTIPSILISRLRTEQEYLMGQSQSFDGQMQRYLGLVLSKRKYVKEMRFYQLYDYIGEKYDKTVFSMLKERMKVNRRFFGFGLLSDLFTFGAIAVSLLLISVDIFHGKAGIGSFVLIYSTVQTMQGALRQMFADMDRVGDRGRYLEDYEEVMSFETEEDGKDSAAMNADAPLTVTFDHVSFCYPGSEREVLKDVSLTIRPGEKIAIVGENGSGKSTFVALLTGLYEPTKGRILVNGKPLADVLRYLRDHISVTTQEFFHLEGTVAENVRIGDYGHPHTDEEVRRALDEAGVLSDIDAYGQKEQTNLGNLYPGSVDLSGGQWQKLAMARNLIKSGAQLMILDEPTAALDPMAESRLYQDFSQLTKDKGVVLISHRLGATRLADRILVFDDGRIVEEGSHKELLREGTLYEQMYQAQAQWYSA